ncbi:MAG: hypothetical protein CMP91_13305 [Gammaproteobacteria bacterium]|nr:hypothetical protein [Gammaproteobacteria bacterium]MAY02041.1 hypothetical protein [Gammaproteobacteria bacterium]|tara:strand:+ start:10266 stop:10664 length:399 start_codon:yes stop_codon:yes gene_type:complete
MKRMILLITGLFGLSLFSLQASAHHNFLAQFDPEQPIQVTGTVVRVALTNPHARIYIEAPDANGELVIWDFELASVSSLFRQGWRRDSLEPGDTVTVHADLARNDPNVGNTRFISLLDESGEEAFRFGSPQE